MISISRTRKWNRLTLNKMQTTKVAQVFKSRSWCNHRNFQFLTEKMFSIQTRCCALKSVMYQKYICHHATKCDMIGYSSNCMYIEYKPSPVITIPVLVQWRMRELAWLFPSFISLTGLVSSRGILFYVVYLLGWIVWRDFLFTPTGRGFLFVNQMMSRF